LLRVKKRRGEKGFIRICFKGRLANKNYKAEVVYPVSSCTLLVPLLSPELTCPKDYLLVP